MSSSGSHDSERVRIQREDIGWKHASMLNGNKLKTQYYFCDKKIQGGGITRFKYHLIGGHKDVAKCKECPDDVHDEIRASMDVRITSQEVQKKEAVRQHIASCTTITGNLMDIGGENDEESDGCEFVDSQGTTQRIQIPEDLVNEEERGRSSGQS